MYNSKNITGLLPLGDFMRLEAGDCLTYELNQDIHSVDAQNFISSYAYRAGAVIAQKKLIIVEPDTGKSCLAIKVTLIEPAEQKKKRGKKS